MRGRSLLWNYARRAIWAEGLTHSVEDGVVCFGWSVSGIIWQLSLISAVMHIHMQIQAGLHDTLTIAQHP
jgi:hypothetical protein